MSTTPTPSLAPAKDEPTLNGLVREAYIESKVSLTHSSSTAMEQSWRSVFATKFDAQVAESAKFGLTGTAFTTAERAAVPVRNAAALAWDAHTIAFGGGNSPKKLTGTYRQYLLTEANKGNQVATKVVEVRKVK